MSNKLNEIINRIEPWQKLVGIIVLIVGGYFAADSWIQKTAKDAVLNEKFLATLAAQVRPTCIFDSRGSVEADFGASDYIDDIQVKPRPELYGYEVLIKAKRYLAYPPLVTGVDVSLVP